MLISASCQNPKYKQFDDIFKFSKFCGGTSWGTKIKLNKGALTYPTCIRRPCWEWPHWNFAEIFSVRKLESTGYTQGPWHWCHLIALINTFSYSSSAATMFLSSEISSLITQNHTALFSWSYVWPFCYYIEVSDEWTDRQRIVALVAYTTQ